MLIAKCYFLIICSIIIPFRIKFETFKIQYGNLIYVTMVAMETTYTPRSHV